ncbi:F0F1 ATP synthase subunit B' [Sneathiella sp. P13V-1]|uniref:F0F1 ATP synthase subunit B family protein n=1 Tax=Sneathiella sp. P13V-1 TaxID=2697366 RepID=UPI00187BA193|nr:F0F1 ATP synthase subunit B' [Sneathiella sp. P13V-1]MBE7635574.1 F0F1 ATP synthase subunit B' [Sneathiella sp. P13V-1]
MPQLNFADFPPQLVWLAISFIVLYVAMAKVAVPRIAEVLESRQDRIARDLDEAKRLSEESDKAKAEYEAALEEARAKAHGMVTELKATLSKEQEASRVDLEAKLASKSAEAEKSIAAAKDEALSNVRQIAGEAAKATVSKLVSIDLADGDVDAAIEASAKGRV